MSRSVRLTAIRWSAHTRPVWREFVETVMVTDGPPERETSQGVQRPARASRTLAVLRGPALDGTSQRPPEFPATERTARQPTGDEGERRHFPRRETGPTLAVRSLRVVIGSFALVLFLFGVWVTSPAFGVPTRGSMPDETVFEACEGVIETSVQNPAGIPGGSRHTIRVVTGSQSGRVAVVTLGAPSIVVRAGTIPVYAPGDRVVLQYRTTPLDGAGVQTGSPVSSNGDGVDAQSERFQITDRVRRPWLYAGIGLIAVASAAVAGWRGLRAMVGLGAAAWIIWWFVVARLLAGQSPVPVAIVGCALIAVTALVLTHGFTREAGVPLAGMAGSLAVAGVVSVVAVRSASLSGLGSNEEIHLVHAALRGEIDTQGLLLAGMLLGAVGGLIDVTVAQTAAVFEFAVTSPLMSRAELFWRGMSVGRAHVVAAVHTLVLAYAGASLPILLLFALYAADLGDIWNRELIAAELLRAVTGIVSLSIAMPLTTWIASRAVPRTSSD